MRACYRLDGPFTTAFPKRVYITPNHCSSATAPCARDGTPRSRRRVAVLPCCRVAVLPCCRVAGLPWCRVAGLPGCRVAGLPGCRVARLTAVGPGLPPPRKMNSPGARFAPRRASPQTSVVSPPGCRGISIVGTPGASKMGRRLFARFARGAFPIARRLASLDEEQPNPAPPHAATAAPSGSQPAFRPTSGTRSRRLPAPVASRRCVTCARRR